MITEKLIDILFSVAASLLALLPDISWDVNTSAPQYLLDVVRMVCYLLPINTIVSIASATIGFATFRACMAFIRTLKDFLPFV